MAYGDGTTGNNKGGVTFKGFSSQAEHQNFKVYDIYKKR